MRAWVDGRGSFRAQPPLAVEEVGVVVCVTMRPPMVTLLLLGAGAVTGGKMCLPCAASEEDFFTGDCRFEAPGRESIRARLFKTEDVPGGPGKLIVCVVG